MIRKLLVFVVVAGLAYACREQLVAALTKTTGTWVGSPQSPSSSSTTTPR